LKRIRKRMKNWLVYRFITSLILFFNLLPRKNAISCGKTLGTWAFLLSKDARRTTLRNLRSVFGKVKNEKELRKIALRVFENIGKNVVDVARFRKLNLSKIEGMIQPEGLKYLYSAYKKGKGVILLTGHIGNFELLGAYLSLKGYRLSAIVRDVYDPRLNKLLLRNRESVGLENISSSADVKKIIKVLKAGRILAILADQDSTRVKGTFVNFLGKAARTPVGPAFLHLKLNSPIIPMVILRNERDRYKIIIKPELEFQPAGDRKEDIRNLTQKYTHVLEEIIREHPCQWVWMHKRWKSRMHKRWKSRPT
jgi:KDO2-lipid IV(A) lauroyltransferase